MRRASLYLFGSLAAAAVLLWAWLQWPESTHLFHRLNSVKVGMTQDEVEKTLGRAGAINPDKDEFVLSWQEGADFAAVTFSNDTKTVTKKHWQVVDEESAPARFIRWPRLPLGF